MVANINSSVPLCLQRVCWYVYVCVCMYVHIEVWVFSFIVWLMLVCLHRICFEFYFGQYNGRLLFYCCYFSVAFFFSSLLLIRFSSDNKPF